MYMYKLAIAQDCQRVRGRASTPESVDSLVYTLLYKYAARNDLLRSVLECALPVGTDDPVSC